MLFRSEITLECVEPFGSGNEPVKQLAAMVAHETSGGNATGQAIITALDLPYEYTRLDCFVLRFFHRVHSIFIWVDMNYLFAKNFRQRLVAVAAWV